MSYQALIPGARQSFDGLVEKYKLDQSTFERWGFMMTEDGRGVATYFDQEIKPLGQRVHTHKEVARIGDLVRCQLWGAHRFSGKGKYLTVMSDELDAMAYSQLDEHKFAIVSVSCLAHFKHNLEWIEGYETVVFMLRNEENALRCAEMLSPGKARIANLRGTPYEMVLKEDGDILKDAMWAARTYRPDGIVSGADLRTKVLSPEAGDSWGILYPYVGLNANTGGLRGRELIVVTGATGSGKTTFMKEIGWHIIDGGERMGWIGLEESPTKTSWGLLTCAVSRPLNLEMRPYDLQVVDGEFVRQEREVVAQQDMIDAWGRVEENVNFYDHFGSVDPDHVLNKIRYMVKGLGCHWIVVDHLHMMLSGLHMTNERLAIERTVTMLRSMIEETGCGLFLVSHLTRIGGEGPNHEEGAPITLANLRGSHAIAQLSDLVIAIERDQRDSSKPVDVRIIKGRDQATILGKACQLKYNRETGRLKEHIDNPFSEVG